MIHRVDKTKEVLIKRWKMKNEVDKYAYRGEKYY